MGDKTGIQWTNATWNPLRGCSRVSKGCMNCYAEKVAKRFSGPGQPYEGLVRLDANGKAKAQWNGTVRFIADKLDQPLRWTKPRMVFVNSMSDLFHESVPFEQIAAIFGVMAACPQHTFQVLTKRPERALEFFGWLSDEWGDMRAERLAGAAVAEGVPDERIPVVREWPLPNVWLGVSVEDQATADQRIPQLLSCPSAVRWVSYEPALGPVDFHEEVGRFYIGWLSGERWGYRDDGTLGPLPRGPRLDWIVVGGESGPGARPFDIEWARSTIRQCRDAHVPVFWKQAGSRPVDGGKPVHLGDRKGGDLLELCALVPDMGPLREYTHAPSGRGRYPTGAGDA